MLTYLPSKIKAIYPHNAVDKLVISNLHPHRWSARYYFENF
nr:MAG TPA: hypothetical protein [Caudoviricetes sp.]